MGVSVGFDEADLLASIINLLTYLQFRLEAICTMLITGILVSIVSKIQHSNWEVKVISVR